MRESVAGMGSVLGATLWSPGGVPCRNLATFHGDIGLGVRTTCILTLLRNWMME
jgi:hypothetical protein